MSKIISDSPPQSLCILRLSALGDISHTLPLFHTIRQAWPNTKITWVIGKVEYELVKTLKDVEFIIFDKNDGLSAYKKLRTTLKNRQFDVLLHMQMSLRASLISLLIKAKVKVGFDKVRAKDAQWLFTNKKIQAKDKEHVIESFFGFTQAIGISEKNISWDVPLSNEEILSAKKILNNDNKYIIISPCSSKAYRNWNTKGYAAVADYIQEKYNFDIVITGGNSDIEKRFASEIIQYCTSKPKNLVGKTSIRELLSVIKGAEFMISPDSGPAHMATAMNTPVIGLYATTNPDRARPYLSSKWTVNRYPEAILKKYNKKVDEVSWGSRVRDDWAMNLITVEDVNNIIDNFMHE